MNSEQMSLLEMPQRRVEGIPVEDKEKIEVSSMKSLKTKALYTLVALLAVCTFVLAIIAKKDSSEKSANGGLHLKHDSDNATYSEKMANRSYLISAATYCDADAIASWTCLHCKLVKGIKNVSVIEDSDNNLLLLLAYDSLYDQVFIAYRGSEMSNFVDYNLDAFMADYEGAEESECQHCLVHSGFQRGYNDLKDIGWTKMKKYIDAWPKAAVSITGHSFGGAMAQFCALDVWDYIDESDSGQSLYLYTQGSPRWANEEMIEYYSAQMEHLAGYWRVVFQHDWAPKMPAYAWGYRHSGNEVWYYCHEPLQYKICSDGDDESCSKGTGIKTSFFDHFVYYNYWSTCDREGKITPVASDCEDVD